MFFIKRVWPPNPWSETPEPKAIIVVDDGRPRTSAASTSSPFNGVVFVGNRFRHRVRHFCAASPLCSPLGPLASGCNITSDVGWLIFDLEKVGTVSGWSFAPLLILTCDV